MPLLTTPSFRTVTIFLRCVRGKEIRMRFSNSLILFIRMTHIILARIPTTRCTKEFSNGYMSAHPKELRDAIDVGEDFLRAIENEHRRRIATN